MLELVWLCFHLVLKLWYQSFVQFWSFIIVSFCFYNVLKVQKQNYRQEKKRAAKELSTALKDPSVIIMSNWLKVWHYCSNSQDNNNLDVKLMSLHIDFPVSLLLFNALNI